MGAIQRRAYDEVPDILYNEYRGGADSRINGEDWDEVFLNSFMKEYRRRIDCIYSHQKVKALCLLRDGEHDACNRLIANLRLVTVDF